MKILLPIDETPCSKAAVDTVLARFAPADADVRVLHVDEWPKGLPTSLSFAAGPAAAATVITMHDVQRRREEALLAATAARLAAARFHTDAELREGDAAREILACAADWQPDVIVMGSHGRSGMERLLSGSVSGQVARHAPCRVEAVRASTAAVEARHRDVA